MFNVCGIWFTSISEDTKKIQVKSDNQYILTIERLEDDYPFGENEFVVLLGNVEVAYIYQKEESKNYSGPLPGDSKREISVDITVTYKRDGGTERFYWQECRYFDNINHIVRTLYVKHPFAEISGIQNTSSEYTYSFTINGEKSFPKTILEDPIVYSSDNKWVQYDQSLVKIKKSGIICDGQRIEHEKYSYNQFGNIVSFRSIFDSKETEYIYTKGY